MVKFGCSKGYMAAKMDCSKCYRVRAYEEEKKRQIDELLARAAQRETERIERAKREKELADALGVSILDVILGGDFKTFTCEEQKEVVEEKVQIKVINKKGA